MNNTDRPRRVVNDSVNIFRFSNRFINSATNTFFWSINGITNRLFDSGTIVETWYWNHWAIAACLKTQRRYKKRTSAPNWRHEYQKAFDDTTALINWRTFTGLECMLYCLWKQLNINKNNARENSQRMRFHQLTNPAACPAIHRSDSPTRTPSCTSRQA